MCSQQRSRSFIEPDRESDDFVKSLCTVEVDVPNPQLFHATRFLYLFFFCDTLWLPVDFCPTLHVSILRASCLF